MSACSIFAAITGAFERTSLSLTRNTRQPFSPSTRSRSASNSTCSGMVCDRPSTSTMSLASTQAKSAMYFSTGCWRRNFAPKNLSTADDLPHRPLGAALSLAHATSAIPQHPLGEHGPSSPPADCWASADLTSFRSVVPLPHLRERLGEGAARNSARRALSQSHAPMLHPHPALSLPKEGEGSWSRLRALECVEDLPRDCLRISQHVIVAHAQDAPARLDQGLRAYGVVIGLVLRVMRATIDFDDQVRFDAGEVAMYGGIAC